MISRCSTADLLSEELRQKDSELKVMGEISAALHSTMNTDEILNMILVGVSCKEGLGFNRVFLFLVDDAEDCIRGQVAIGPSNAEEAGRIWGAIGDEMRPLKEVMANYLHNVGENDIEANHIIKRVRIPLDRETVFSTVVKTGYWCNVTSPEQFVGREHIKGCELFASRFAIVPLISRSRVFGMIVADNLITSRSIEDSDVHILQIFADHAASAIQNSRLFAEIDTKAHCLQQANERIKRIQKQISAIEKSSLLAEVTYKIAHELRNPLTIIGGFAALLNRNLDPADKLNEYAGIIMNEILRVEKSLTDVLNFSKSLAEEVSATDLAKIVKSTAEVLEQKLGESSTSVKFTIPEAPLPVRLNHDQTVQSLYNILDLFVTEMPIEAMVEVRVAAVEQAQRIEIHFRVDDQDRGQIKEFLSRILKESCKGSSLSLTLAMESIKYNAGEPGLACSEIGEPYFYIEYPVLEEQHV